MLTTLHGTDLLRAPTDALVNPVNCVGVMGKGLALQFKLAFPANFVAYAAACARHELQPGHVHVFSTGKPQPRFILNFPTKRHWRDGSRLEDIRAGLEDLARLTTELKLTSIAIPPLGCGLGGLPWSQVEPLIRSSFEPLGHLQVLVHAPARGLSHDPSGRER